MDDPVVDAYLVRRAQDGYLDAFEELTRRHQGRGYAVAVRMLGDTHEAQDVVQDAFIAAWRGLARFQGDSMFGTWFYRILVNQCLMSRRRRRPDPVASTPELPDNSDPQRIVEDKFRDKALHLAIQELPAEQRAPLVLVTFAGFSYEEAAQILNTSTSTLRGRVARARKALLTRLRGWT